MSQRHELIFVDSLVNFTIDATHLDLDFINKNVVAWFQKGLPAVVARMTREDKGVMRLGLPILVDDIRYRVGLSVPQSAIIKRQPLPKMEALKRFFTTLPGLTHLKPSDAVFTHCADVSVYGSFLFQYLSQQSYVHDGSDLDILIDYKGCCLSELQALMNCLHRAFNRTIDGEIRFKNIGDISIRELLESSSDTLLCKCIDKVYLLSRETLYAVYPTLRYGN